MLQPISSLTHIYSWSFTEVSTLLWISWIMKCFTSTPPPSTWKHRRCCQPPWDGSPAGVGAGSRWSPPSYPGPPAGLRLHRLQPQSAAGAAPSTTLHSRLQPGLQANVPLRNTLTVWAVVQFMQRRSRLRSLGVFSKLRTPEPPSPPSPPVDCPSPRLLSEAPGATDTQADGGAAQSSAWLQTPE